MAVLQSLALRHGAHAGASTVSAVSLVRSLSTRHDRSVALHPHCPVLDIQVRD